MYTAGDKENLGMEETQAKRIIEALLFVFGQSVPFKRITDVLPDLSAAEARRLISVLNEEYSASKRAFHIQEVAGGFQLVTDKALAPWVKRALEHPKPDSVSTAALETLAIIAYRQPATKAEIETIRGVDVSASLETLLERQFIRIAGRKESPGRPFLYGTTPEFLRHFGLRSIEALPTMPTPTIQETTSVIESDSVPAPSEQGEGSEKKTPPPAPAATESLPGPVAVGPGQTDPHTKSFGEGTGA